MQNCIFCKIINKEISAKVIRENDAMLVIQDIVPKAPIHYLIIPKKHIKNMMEISDSDKDMMWEMVKVVKSLAEDLPDSKSFNILSNNGKEAGQVIFHIHWHFLSGRNIIR